jgi:hypothetical protein
MCCPDGVGNLPGGATCHYDENGAHNEECCSVAAMIDFTRPDPCVCCSPERTGFNRPLFQCQTTNDCCFGRCRGGLCSCETGASACGTNIPGGFRKCDPVKNCFCMNGTDGSVVCADLPLVNNRCTDLPSCGPAAPCDSGEVCVQDPCCPIAICVPACTQVET